MATVQGNRPHSDSKLDYVDEKAEDIKIERTESITGNVYEDIRDIDLLVVNTGKERPIGESKKMPYLYLRNSNDLS